MTIGNDNTLYMAQVIQNMEAMTNISQIQNVSTQGTNLPLAEISQESSSKAMQAISYSVENNLIAMETATTLAIVDMYV